MHEMKRRRPIKTTEENLDILRMEIDVIDKEIANLLEKRLDIAKQIGVIKTRKGVPILDEKREEKVVEHILENIRNSSLAPAMMRIYEKIMDESKQVQSD